MALSGSLWFLGPWSLDFCVFSDPLPNLGHFPKHNGVTRIIDCFCHLPTFLGVGTASFGGRFRGRGHTAIGCLIWVRSTLLKGWIFKLIHHPAGTTERPGDVERSYYGERKPLQESGRTGATGKNVAPTRTGGTGKR
jgi:hypothetical protein